MFVTGEISPSNIGLTSFVNASKSVSRSDFAGGVLQRDRHTVCPCRRSMVGDKPHGISIKGRVNIDTSGDMRRTIADASRSRPPAVMLDLSRVSYLDTSDMEAFAPSRRQRSDKVQWQILHDRLARPRAGGRQRQQVVSVCSGHCSQWPNRRRPLGGGCVLSPVHAGDGGVRRAVGPRRDFRPCAEL
jgi:hypothetical protein